VILVDVNFCRLQCKQEERPQRKKLNMRNNEEQELHKVELVESSKRSHEFEAMTISGYRPWEFIVYSIH
jgi:hypothetical protein